jgi:tetratricopeptide (TPR) repeat protein
VAGEKTNVKDRAPLLAPAKKLVNQLLWERGRPVYFGKAIAMKASIELLNGNVKKAKETIDEYLEQLVSIHNALLQHDPEGTQGLLKLSPLPLCLYMRAEMLWKEALNIASKKPRDDEAIKSLLFGEKKRNGRGRDGKGAFNFSINVFVKYPESSWAVPAGELSEEIKNFAVKEYGANIKTSISPEQMNRVRAMMFKSGDEKFATGKYAEAIADFMAALPRFPEGLLSISAIEKVITSYVKLAYAEKDEAKKLEYRLDADAVEGYLAERFAGNSEKSIMTAGGDAVLRIAAMEKEMGNLSRSDALYKMFFKNYNRHISADTVAAAMAGEKMKDKFFADAIALWQMIRKYYPKSMYYNSSLAHLATCYENLGERAKAIECMKQYAESIEVPIEKMQGRMQLALLYQKDGLDSINAASTNENKEVAAKMLRTGSAQLIRAIKQFSGFADEASTALANPGLSEADRKKYTDLREKALYFVGEFWSRLTKPEEKLPMFRKYAAENFEKYVAAYPNGQYAKWAYVKLGTIYTALSETEKAKEALTRLSKEFPDSQEAKNAKPRLAKALIEMGMKDEGTKIYGEMLSSDGKYSAIQFVRAGEALIDAGSWDLADRAFDKAIRIVGTNVAQRSTIGRARIGQAKALFKQKQYDSARENIDAFLEDKNMSRLSIAADANLLMVEVASEQGRAEKSNPALRKKHFNAAVGALKKVRNYWKGKSVSELDGLDIMSADIKIDQMHVEDALGDTKSALESCERAAATLMHLAQMRVPGPGAKVDKFTAEQMNVLEGCLSRMVPLYTRLATEDKSEDPRYRAGFVEKYGQVYLDLFPNGKNRTEIINCMNKAKPFVVREEKLGESAQPSAEDKTEAEKEVKTATEKNEKESVNE